MYDGVEVLQSAAVERIDEIPSRPRPLELGVEHVTVLKFKNKIGGRGRCPLGLGQLTQSEKLMERIKGLKHTHKESFQHLSKNMSNSCYSSILETGLFNCTSSFWRVFTAKLLEDRTQCTRAR